MAAGSPWSLFVRAAALAAFAWTPGQGVRITEEAHRGVATARRAGSSADAAAAAGAAAALQSAAQAFLKSEALAADVHATRRSRLLAGLEREGVSLEQLFGWYLLQTAVEAGHPGTPDKAARSLAELAGRGSEEKASLEAAEAGPRRPPDASVCAYKLGENGEWQKRLISLHRGVLTYEPTSECRNSGAWNWFEYQVGHEQTLSLEDILPPSQIEAVAVSDLPKTVAQVPEENYASCVIVPLTTRDFTVCLESAGARDQFLKALKLHQVYAGGAAPVGGTVPQDPAEASRLLDETARSVPSDSVSDEAQGNSAEFLAADAQNVAGTLKAAKLSPKDTDLGMAGSALQAAVRLEKMTQELKSTRSTPLSESGDYSAYRQFRMKESLKYFASKGSLPQTRLEQAKQLRLKVIALNSRIEKGVKALEKASALEWARLEKSHKGVLAALSAAAQAVGRALVDGTIASQKYMRRKWSSFKVWVGLQEEQCTKEDRKVESEAVAAGGLQIQGLKRGLEEGGREPQEKEIRAELGKADAVLKRMDTGDHGTGGAVRSLQNSGKTLEGAAGSSGSNELAALAAAQEHSEAAKRALERVCQRSRAEQAKSMKGMLDKVKEPYVLQPELGIRGVSGHVPFVSGGLEEVVDFRNREIGYFASRSLVVGGSLGGINVGGYTGVGWKGYKQNWTLQETYQVGIFASYGIGTPFGMVGLGLTYAVDADTSGPYWVTDRKGVNGVLLGWGAGVSLFDLGTKLDVGMARKWMYTTECFESRKDFLLALWGLTCSSCTGTTERAAMLGFRTLTHLTSFPILTDLLFTALAFNAERHVPADYERQCSILSTRTRDDATYITSSVGRDLAQAVENLKSAQSRYIELAEELELVKDRDDLAEVQAYQDLLEGMTLHTTCPAHPKTSSYQLLREDVLFAGFKYDFLKQQASKTNPFGLCDKGRQCTLKGQACRSAEEEEPRCSCQEGLCYDVTEDGSAACVKPGKPAAALLDSVNAWAKVVELELGAAAVELEQLLASAGSKGR